MKKGITLLVLAAMIGQNSLFAAQACNSSCGQKSEVKEIKQPETCPNTCPKKEFAWGIGVCGLAVIGVVAGFTASMASESN